MTSQGEVTHKPRRRIALLIDADNFRPYDLKEIRDSLASLGRLVLQRAYLSSFSDKLKILGGDELKLNVVGTTPQGGVGFVRQKSIVDAHMMIDAMNLKWAAKLDGTLNTFAIVSKDSDFRVLVDDIRSTTNFDVYGFIPAADHNVSTDYANCFCRTFRYGRQKQSRGRELTDEQENELWVSLSGLGYAAALRPVMLFQLEMFSHVHDLDVTGVTWRNDFAQIVLQHFLSGRRSQVRPNNLLHIASVLATGTRALTRKFMVIHISDRSKSNIVFLVLRFLEFERSGQDVNIGAIADFLNAQMHFRFLDLDRSILQRPQAEQVEYLYNVFLSASNLDRSLAWTRRR